MDLYRRALDHNWRKSLMEKNYAVLERIDEGSFGEVHTIHKIGETVLYAVKAIRANGAVTDDEYILAEIRSLLELRHPHIVAMYDLILQDNFACIVMEYATQGNLEKYTIHHHPIDDQFLSQSFSQILSAVAYCHSRFIAHKDINPSNILIFNNDCVKIADFGLAVKCHDSCGCLVLCEDYLGQNSYLAPEILNRCPHNAMSSDVWSLGCLLYFMLCGKPPFEGTAEQIAQCQVKIGFQLPTKLLRSVEFIQGISNVIKKLSKVDPMLRLSIHQCVEIWEDVPDKHGTHH
ncbi:hypothetical protein LOTGIDRAFT_154250 [Lottia gigantea]|uniref:Protein kinase domain-containing protein n=1 Tax=Lottia gigantea TaxID=225164 RepID=V3ZDH0_LOTGI|nr:hypothetical protein LOTGIDRAFT_154250 [Lottia gigantea]ESO89163.1 hypothetical protein LOTGIDRAFT_154250 [Lottia gigantea]